VLTLKAALWLALPLVFKVLVLRCAGLGHFTWAIDPVPPPTSASPGTAIFYMLVVLCQHYSSFFAYPHWRWGGPVARLMFLVGVAIEAVQHFHLPAPPDFWIFNVNTEGLARACW